MAFLGKSDEALTFKGKGIKEFHKSDTLNVGVYAKVLSEFVQSCETPMTIGVQGDWGIGKTSMLNLISSHLSPSENGVLWFNTWHYSMFGQEEYLGLAVIKGLLQQMEVHFQIEEEDGPFKKAMRSVSNVMKNAQFGAFGASISLGDASKSSDDMPDYVDVSSEMLKFRFLFEQIVEKILSEKKLERLVIFIDDIDRVKPVKALELLESLKNFLDVEKCVFLLAVDYEVVQIGMAQKLGQDLQKRSGKSFFDKIIQTPFIIPSNSYDLKSFITKLFEGTALSFNSTESKQYIEDVTTCTVGRNPRSIKRVTNYAKLINAVFEANKQGSGIRVSEQRNKVLYSLVCMQVAWPEIFNHFVGAPTAVTIRNIENWEYLDAIPFIQNLYDRSPNVDQLKSNISAFFDLLYELLDENRDGHIGTEELQPVHQILHLAKLTNTDNFIQPIDEYFNLVQSNSGKKFTTLITQFKRSKFYNSGKVDYRSSGKRYVTIVGERKQIGTLVSLQKNPFIFRLSLSPQSLLNLNENLRDIIVINEDPRLTGFGDYVIDVDRLSSLAPDTIVAVLNEIFDFVMEYYKLNK